MSSGTSGAKIVGASEQASVMLAKILKCQDSVELVQDLPEKTAKSLGSFVMSWVAPCLLGSLPMQFIEL